MKLGFYTYSYIDRLKMDVEPVLETVAGAGYDGIDISATWRDDLDPALMPPAVRNLYVRTAGRLNLEIEAVVTHLGLVQALRDNLPLNLRGAVDLARDVGARVVTVHIGFADFLMGETGKVWRNAVDYLKDAAGHAAAHGVVIALDGVWSSFLVHRPELVVKMIEDVGSPGFRFNFDPCYLELSGHSLDRATPLLAPYSVHAHIKDYTGGYPDFAHRIPGEGVLDHGRYLRALAAAGYDRYVINECFIDAPLERSCTVGYRTLARALGAARRQPAGE
jgi:sugar phosphate isomerase/epimerase